MYPRLTEALDRVQLTATRDKENVAPEHERECKPAPTPKPPTFRCTLVADNTAIIGDTLNFEALSVHELNGTALGPAALLAGLRAAEQGNDAVYYHLWVAARAAVEEHGGRELDSRLVRGVMERLVVEVGLAAHVRCGGPHIAFVDPRRHDDAPAIVRSARRLAALFRAHGMSERDIVISIPATEAGVAAARTLEAAHGIHTNLTLIAGLMHAAVCAEARATVISIAVGPLLQSHERRRRAVYRDLALHPGVDVVQAVFAYFRLHEIRTRVVGRDFRELAELSALRGFDAVCLSKAQLEASLWAAETRSAEADLADASEPPQAASMRARQAQHPTAFLEHGEKTGVGFTALMSAEARGTLTATMGPALARMARQMEGIETLVTAEVAWQLALRTRGLDALYALRDAYTDAEAPPSSPAAKTEAATKTRRNRGGEGEIESNQVGGRAAGRENQKGGSLSQRRSEPLGEALRCERQRQNEGGLIEGVEYF